MRFVAFALIAVTGLTLACSSGPLLTDAQQFAIPQRAPAFAGKRSSEAIMTFSHRVEMHSLKKPTKAQAEKQIKDQLDHLFGPMENAEFEDRKHYKAAPKEDHTAKIKSIQLKAGSKNLYEITYDYSGTIVVESGPRDYYEILLPINPDTIYRDAKDGGPENPCVDPHYQTKEDFWYFWSPKPKYPNCKLEEGKHYHSITARIERIKPEAKTTYPEYHRLFEGTDTFDIHMLFGKDEAVHGKFPDTSKDVGARNYVAVREELAKLGFEIRDWDLSEIRKIHTVDDERHAPFVQELTKEYPGKSKKIRIRMFYGQTEIWQKNHRPFHFFFRDAIENSTILIYDGHSGLGSHLDLEEIRKKRGGNFKFEFQKNKYQIFFFNSCSSYTYYNTLYFQRKRTSARGVDPKGTLNLDILVNGLSTDYERESDLAMIRAIDLWLEKGHWTSYQRLARRIDTDNLFTVAGDEDNPTKPVRE